MFTAPCCSPTLPLRYSLISAPTSRVRVLKLRKPSSPLALPTRFVDSPYKSSRYKWRFSCFRREESSEFFKHESVENSLPEEAVSPVVNQTNTVKDDWLSKLRKATDAVFGAEPWTVPWTAKTILQVMLLWIATFWLVGSWIIPFLAHTSGFRKETLSYRGQALYSLLTDVAEGLAGIAILHRCLAQFRPLPSDWFRFSLQGKKWLFEVGLGCLMFPLVNRLSQVNLNLLPMLPSTPVTVSNVEQSIFARDPVAMALYAIVVSVCAPVWEEIVFRGFLLPSLTSMETSRPLSIESFSYSWLANLKPSFESSAGNSFRESLDESSSFIEMDPTLSSSKRFFRIVPQDLDFDFPVLSQTPRTLVHADELISNGFLMPLFVKQLKPEAYDDDDDDDTSDFVPNSQISSCGPPEKLQSGKRFRCSSLKRCRKLSKRIFQKYLDFLKPLCQRVRRRSGSRVGATDVKSWEYNYSTSTSPRASVAYSGDNWRRSCDSESSIYEAVLHCKRTIGQENH